MVPVEIEGEVGAVVGVCLGRDGVLITCDAEEVEREVNDATPPPTPTTPGPSSVSSVCDGMGCRALVTVRSGVFELVDAADGTAARCEGPGSSNILNSRSKGATTNDGPCAIRGEGFGFGLGYDYD